MANPSTSARSGKRGLTSERLAPEKAALPAWAGEVGWESDVIISTRARLARNIAGLPFPGRASDADLGKVARRVLHAAQRREKGTAALRAVDIGKLGDNAKAALVDSHLISVQHAGAGAHRWALVDDKHTISVMVNEEDHLRLQAILPGLQLDSAYKIADQLDDLLSSELEYAYDAKYGYLTSSLSNCGTGLRLSVMAHLPGLARSHKLEDALAAARTLGGTIRGLYGEHSGAVGDVYQLSNAVSIGLTERQILARLAASATYLLTDEQAARELLWRGQRSVIEDQVGEAQEHLRAAERLNADDALAIISTLRLGQHVGIETGMSSRTFNTLLASMRTGVHLVPGRDARSVFYEETRRPALIRNTLRANK